jgi:uncharacterized protein
MQQTYYAFNKTRESFLGLNITCAQTPAGRLRGLLGRLRVGMGEGVWVIPSNGIHTVGMLFPIDVVYLDADLRVILLAEHLRPFRISPICMRSASLLELPQHTIYASQTKVGDQILICSPEEMETYLASDNRAETTEETSKGVLG